MAITGMGLLTPLGAGVAAAWDALESGRTGVKVAPEDGRPPWMRYVGEVAGVELPSDLPPKLAREGKFLNRGGVLGTIAAAEAARQAAIPDALPAERRALYLATGDLSRLGYVSFYPATRVATGGKLRGADTEKLNRATIGLVSPFILLESLTNNPFSFLAAAFSCMGPGTCLASHSPSGGHALELACRTLRGGRADAALVVGCGSWLAEVALLELARLGVLSRGRRGAESYRPFDRQRDGFLAGEGGAALVLEPLALARQRGAPVLATVEGTGNRTEAVESFQVPSHVTLGAMREALAQAGVAASKIGFICPHGSGTRAGDRAELASLAALLGAAAPEVPVCALKPYTGHMGAASDLAEVILCVLAARRGFSPATLGFRTPEDGFAGLRIAPRHQPCRQPRFLSVSYGAAGQTSAVVVAVPVEHGPDG